MGHKRAPELIVWRDRMFPRLFQRQYEVALPRLGRSELLGFPLGGLGRTNRAVPVAARD